MEKKEQFSLWYFLIVFLAILAMQNFLFGPHAENLAYNEFKSLLRAGKVENIAIGERAISGTLKSDGLEGLLPREKLEELKRAGEGKEHRFVTVRVDDPALVTESTRPRCVTPARSRANGSRRCCPGSCRRQSSWLSGCCS